jgi:hypothetical protein
MPKDVNRSKKKDPIHNAEEQAERDMSNDPDLSAGDPTDDLDEGELAQRDNSDEDAFDELEKKRPAPKPRPNKDKEK